MGVAKLKDTENTIKQSKLEVHAADAKRVKMTSRVSHNWLQLITSDWIKKWSEFFFTLSM